MASTTSTRARSTSRPPAKGSPAGRSCSDAKKGASHQIWAICQLKKVPATKSGQSASFSRFGGWHLIPKGVLSLDGLPTLDAATAKALAEFTGPLLSLTGLNTLEADTAKALAEFKGDLFLNGLSTLDAATAKALAEFQGRVLSLNGLTMLDFDTAMALAELSEEHVFMPQDAVQRSITKYSLTPDTALMWAKLSKGDLSAITAFDTPDSVAIAEALATRQGKLSLPNLRKISPKTLVALLKKNDVEIPLVETLELIPEPDGSLNDDVLLPDDVVKGRQRQPQ